MGNSQSIDLIVDPANQSEITDKNERSRMSKLCKNGKYLCEYEDGEVKTLYDAFKRGARVSNNGEAYGWKPSPSEPFQWISYNDVLVRAANVGAGLIAKGLKPENTTNVGIYSQTGLSMGSQNKPAICIPWSLCRCMTHWDQRRAHTSSTKLRLRLWSVIRM